MLIAAIANMRVEKLAHQSSRFSANNRRSRDQVCRGESFLRSSLSRDQRLSASKAKYKLQQEPSPRACPSGSEHPRAASSGIIRRRSLIPLISLCLECSQLSPHLPSPAFFTLYSLKFGIRDVRIILGHASCIPNSPP